MTQRGKMSARIPCTEDVQKALKSFTDGAGITYDELLRYFLAQHGVSVENDTETTIVIEGSKLRAKFTKQRLDEIYSEED